MGSPKNVFILGTAYCGSTLLGNALNSHSKMAFAGEVSRVPAFGIGSPWTTCPLCYTREVDCPIWTPEFIERIGAAGAGGALDVYREAAGKPIVIDGSKHVQWLRVMHTQKALPADTFMIVAARSPFAFASSTIRRENWVPWFAGNVWRDTTFDMLRCIGDFGFPHGIVRYEEFALEPEKILTRICDWLGLEFEPQMLQFWETPVHGLGGNAGSYVWYEGFEKAEYEKEPDKAVAETYQRRTFGGWVDEKWHQQLSDHDVRLIMRTPGIMDMCSLMGYDVFNLVKRREELLAKSAQEQAAHVDVPADAGAEGDAGLESPVEVSTSSDQ